MNELATALGVFTPAQPLSPSKMDSNRLFISSRINPMAGRVAFERMTCGGGVYVRVRVNDAVYPLKECQSGPGKTCELKAFGKVIKAKVDKAGDLIARQGSCFPLLVNGKLIGVNIGVDSRLTRQSRTAKLQYSGTQSFPGSKPSSPKLSQWSAQYLVPWNT